MPERRTVRGGEERPISPILRRTPASRCLVHSAYLEMLHLPPITMVLLAAAGFVAIAVGDWPPLPRLAEFLTAILLTQIAISLHNDYCDRDLDAKTKPWRAIPSGLVSTATVLRLTGLFLGLGLLAAAQLGLLVAALVAVGTFAGLTYNAWLKRSIWTWLPFWVALPSLVISAFAVVERLEPWLWQVYILGAPLALAIYLADTLRDVESDTTHGVHGLAQRLGTARARIVCWSAIALALVLALVLRSSATTPGPLYLVAAGSLAAAVPLGLRRVRRGHWLAIMVGAIALSTDWLAAMNG